MQYGWRYVEDGQIIGGPKALPTNWRDKGDISDWPLEQLRAEGWLPNYVVDLRVPGEVDAGWTDELLEDRVVQTLRSRPMTPEELAARRAAEVPQAVTMRQARQALILAGLLDDVNAAIAAIADPTVRAMAVAEWEYSQVVERQRGLVAQMGAALGLTQEQIDNLFIAAARL